MFDNSRIIWQSTVFDVGGAAGLMMAPIMAGWALLSPLLAAAAAAAVPAVDHQQEHRDGLSSWPTPMPAPIVSISDFRGAKADNSTSNTQHFKAAVAQIEAHGGGTLLVPKGTWLTGPFNLTSNMTLFIMSGGTIQGSTDLAEWPLMPPMKSYGQGRDHPGPRHVSLLHGFHLGRLTIGGENGTVNGGGPFWWARHRTKRETHTRGHLFECMHCSDLLFQDVTFRDSPFWTVHPVFSRRVTARRLTVLNDNHSPNTDGFDPDSTSEVLIEDSFFSTGDDGGEWCTQYTVTLDSRAVILAHLLGFRRSGDHSGNQKRLELLWRGSRRPVDKHRDPQPDRGIPHIRRRLHRL